MSMLSDEQIRDWLDKKWLVIDPYEPGNVRGASYDVRVGKLVESSNEHRQFELNEGDTVHLKPNDVVTITTLEDFQFRRGDLAATIHSRVRLVVHGVTHISTIVDPYWEGPLEITMSNLNPNIIVPLTYGEEFCRIVFYQLGSEASRRWHEMMRQVNKASAGGIVKLKPVVNISQDGDRNFVVRRDPNALVLPARSRKYKVAWDEVLGYSNLKSTLEEQVIKPIGEGRKRFASIVLFGPPGTSKSTLATALAQKLNWPYLMIDPKFFYIRGENMLVSTANEILSTIKGMRNVVVILDEFDFLAPKRTESSAELGQTGQFLKDMAALHEEAQIVLVAITNNLSVIERAAHREGRFDLVLGVGPPDALSRIAILTKFLGSSSVDVDVKQIAGVTENMTFDELVTLCNKARSGGGAASTEGLVELAKEMRKKPEVDQETLDSFKKAMKSERLA